MNWFQANKLWHTNTKTIKNEYEIRVWLHKSHKKLCHSRVFINVLLVCTVVPRGANIKLLLSSQISITAVFLFKFQETPECKEQHISQKFVGFTDLLVYTSAKSYSSSISGEFCVAPACDDLVSGQQSIIFHCLSSWTRCGGSYFGFSIEYSCF